MALVRLRDKIFVYQLALLLYRFEDCLDLHIGLKAF